MHRLIPQLLNSCNSFPSMFKMAYSCENHRHLTLVRGGNDLLVADGAPGLDGGRCARF